MRFQGAVIEAKDETMAVVIVEKQVVDHPSKAEDATTAFKAIFGKDVPVVLVGQDAIGRPTYHGRDDLVEFIKSVRLKDIPWQEYAVS